MPSRNRTILCIEDEDLQLKARRMLFESAVYSVVEATSAIETISTFRSVPVDAVVVDYWLSEPGGNGTVAAQEMKRIRPNVPMVILSTFCSLPGDTTVVDSWMRKGEADPGILVREVSRLIELRSSSSQAGAAE